MGGKGVGDSVTGGSEGGNGTIRRSIDVGNANGRRVSGLPLEMLNPRVCGSLRMLEVSTA